MSVYVRVAWKSRTETGTLGRVTQELGIITNGLSIDKETVRRLSGFQN
jgi:hypothetical protein